MTTPHLRMPPRPQQGRYFHALQHVALLHNIQPLFSNMYSSFGLQSPLKMVPFVDGFHLPDHNSYEQLQAAWADHNDHSLLKLQLHVHANTQLQQPVLLLHVGTQHERRSDPLVTLTLQPHSRLQLLEYCTSDLSPCYFYDSMLRIQLQQHSQLQHMRILHNSRNAQYRLRTQVQQHSHTVYNLHEIALSGQWRSSSTEVQLQQPHASCNLHLLDLGQQQQCSHHRFAVHHQAANCNSQQQHRGLYAGRAQGIFAGQVIVDKEAVGTQAHQLSRSLLLSPQAQAYSEPQLQIDTDDVQCGHGATVSQLDENALFYLQSRGIERYRAHCMLTEAFAQDALHNLQPAWLHGWLQQRVNRLLSAVASA